MYFLISITAENLEHHSLSSKCNFVYNSNVFGSSIIHILYTGCAKIKKNNSGAKRLMEMYFLISITAENLEHHRPRHTRVSRNLLFFRSDDTNTVCAN